MAPPEKVTADQKVHLVNLMDSYLETKKNGGFAKFWANVYEGWFKLWPEQEDMSLKDANERREALTNNTQARQKVSEQVQVGKISTLMYCQVSPKLVPESCGPESKTYRKFPKSAKRKTRPATPGGLFRPVLRHTNLR